jgi:carboxyl-terminal processing protease
VIDLRNDPGGYLDAAVGLGGQFVDSKMIVEERTDGKSTNKLTSGKGGLLLGKQTAVLINGGSASASEILAGALQDYKAATIVGEKSFGKGSVQEIISLSGGSELKVTVAHWYTPNGVNISKEGIKPDVEVKLEQADFDANRDPQLDKALDLLK